MNIIFVRLEETYKNNIHLPTQFKQHFNDTTSCTDLHNYMTFKVVNQLNLIAAMKILQNPTTTYVCRDV